MNPTTIHPHAQLLSIAQAAQESGIPTGTLRKLIAEGELSAVRIPGVRRVFINRRQLQTRIDKTWVESA